MKNEHENFELRAEINKLRVENKILRDLAEKTGEELMAAKKMVDDLKPQIVEAMEACKKLVSDADKFRRTFNSVED